MRVVDDLDRVESECRVDAVVNLAGEPLVSGLWTKKRKRVFLESRLSVTAHIESFIRRLKRRPLILVNASAIGFYGDRSDEILTEVSGSQDIFMSTFCARWEDAAARMETLGLRVCRSHRARTRPQWRCAPVDGFAGTFGLTAQFDGQAVDVWTI